MAALGGKTALVTGGSRRVGREIVLALAREGMRVVFSFRSRQEDARETERLARNEGSEVQGLPAELTSLSECAEMIRMAEEAAGPVDVLVNNASEFTGTRVDGTPDPVNLEQVFDRMSRVHILAPLFLSLSLGTRMKKRGWGRIVNITDRVVARHSAYPNHSIYLATKYGLFGLTQGLALDLAPEVLVNSVAPGLVIPPDSYEAGEVEDMIERIPLRRMAGAREIARDVVLLLESEFKTGTVIISDGGEGLCSLC